MTSHALRYLANCSMLFTEVPLLERPAVAKAAGFDTVEFWWPWPDQPVPGDREIDAFVAAVEDAGVQLAGLNFFAGDLAGPDCGVLSIPSRSQPLITLSRRADQSGLIVPSGVKPPIFHGWCQE